MSYLAFTRKFTCVVVVAGILGAGPATAGVFISEDAAHSTSLLAELTHSVGTAASALTIHLQSLAPVQDTVPTGVGALTAVVLNNPGDKIASVSLDSPTERIGASRDWAPWLLDV